jgi:hypothetical protein
MKSILLPMFHNEWIDKSFVHYCTFETRFLTSNQLSKSEKYSVPASSLAIRSHPIQGQSALFLQITHVSFTYHIISPKMKWKHII